jgi:hypothetical protein
MLKHKIKAITCLKNSGILMELDSDKAAQWIQRNKTHEEFLKNIHKDAMIKPRLFHVSSSICSANSPTRKPNRSSRNRGVQWTPRRRNSESKMDQTHSEVKTHVNLWPSSHLIFSFTDENSANETLVNSLFVCKTKVCIEKCKKEPLRCLKCHRWNHLALECSRTQDTCSTCVHQHWTSECTNQEQPRCTPCNADSHTSWDRNCPAFQSKCSELNERMEENQMLYYLTHKVWTQAKEPLKANYTSQPRPLRVEQKKRVGNYIQSRLPFQRGKQGLREP